MPWFKVDDGLHAHKKAVRAGVPAMGLWVLAGSWCADQLTDGWVPDYIAARLDRDYIRHASALVKANLWIPDEVDGEQGWRFHQWGEQQPSAESVLDKREAAKERMRRVREERRAGSQPVRANTARTSQEVRSTPTRPDPTLSSGTSRYSSQGRNARDAEPPPSDEAPSVVEKIMTEYRDNSPRGVSRTVAAKLAGHVHELLADGFHENHIREGLGQLRVRKLGPGVLPSLVDEIANAPAASNVVPMNGRANGRAPLPPSSAPTVIPPDERCPEHRGERKGKCRHCRAIAIGRPQEIS